MPETHTDHGTAHTRREASGRLADDVGRELRAREAARPRGPGGLERRDHTAKEILDGNVAALGALGLKGSPSLEDARAAIVRLIEIHMTLARGYTPILEPLWDLVRRVAAHEGRPVRVLDVGAGQGAVLRRLYRRAEGSGVAVDLAAGDHNPDYVRRQNERFEDEALPIRAVVADATDLSGWEDGSVDIVMHTLMLHHLGPEDAALSLLEADRVAKHGLYVVDVDRSTAARRGFAVAGALTLHRFRRAFRHDANASVRRADTPADARWLLPRLGIAQRYRVLRPPRPPWRKMLWRLEPMPR